MRGPDLTETEGFAESFVRRLQTTRELHGIDCRILGPAPPPLSKLRGKYRFHAILASARSQAAESVDRQNDRPTSNRPRTCST